MRIVYSHVAPRQHRNRLIGGILTVVLCALIAGMPAWAQLGPPPVPAQNPQTPEKIALGKALFWDEQLSLTGTVACGTCHRPQAGGADPRTTPLNATHPGPDEIFGTDDDMHGSPGVVAHGADGHYRPSPYFGLNTQVGRRVAPSVYDAAYAPRLFWDGRAEGTFFDPETFQTLIPSGGALETQSLNPLVDTSEMGHAGSTMAGAGERIDGVIPLALATDVPPALASFIDGRGYPSLFEEVFGTPEISAARIAFALASYQRALAQTETPWDLELAGIPTLTDQERAGRLQFQRLRCHICHGGPRLGDNSFRYIGVRPVEEDLGRFNQTGSNGDRGAFRVSSLRNIGLRGPFMHNGGLETLDEVLSFYKRGGDFDAPNKDELIGPLFLNDQERADLLVYLVDALTDPRIVAEQPPYDRPTLYTESALVATITGSGEPGASGVPLIAALEPPIISNRNFTVTLSNVPIGSTATLVVSRTDPGLQSTVPVGDFANISGAAVGMSGFQGGYLSTQVNLAVDPTLTGQTLYGRYYVADPVAANQLSISRAFEITVFGELDWLLVDGFE